LIRLELYSPERIKKQVFCCRSGKISWDYIFKCVFAMFSGTSIMSDGSCRVN
jgi:hypothetical protein